MRTLFLFLVAILIASCSVKPINNSEEEMAELKASINTLKKEAQVTNVRKTPKEITKVEIFELNEQCSKKKEQGLLDIVQYNKVSDYADIRQAMVLYSPETNSCLLTLEIYNDSGGTDYEYSFWVYDIFTTEFWHYATYYTNTVFFTGLAAPITDSIHNGYGQKNFNDFEDYKGYAEEVRRMLSS